MRRRGGGVIIEHDHLKGGCLPFFGLHQEGESLSKSLKFFPVPYDQCTTVWLHSLFCFLQ